MFDSFSPERKSQIKHATKRLAPYVAVAVVSAVLTKKTIKPKLIEVETFIAPGGVVPLRLDRFLQDGADTVAITLSDGIQYFTELPPLPDA